MLKHPFRFLWIFLFSLSGIVALPAAPLHIAPNGADGAAGTVEQPLSLKGAFERASTDATITEIIVAGGEYSGSFGLGSPKDADPAKLPPLIVRAAEGQKPVLHYSSVVDKADAVDGLAGVYQIKASPRAEPQMWERDTRVRYTILSNKASVGAFEGSCFYDSVDGLLYFHTSDGKPAQNHKIGFSLGGQMLIGSYRPNVIFDGLSFRDFCDGAVFQTYGNGTTIRRCHFDNCLQAWVPQPNTKDIVMEDCTGTDVAQPMISFGNDVAVRGCRFEKHRDRFLMPMYPQNDSAYEVYDTGRGGTFLNNFAKGYLCGIWIKAGGKYVIRHNTIIDCHIGVEWVTGNTGSDTSFNVVVNAHEFINVDHFDEGFTTDYNLCWNPESPTTLNERTAVVRGANRGKMNLIADPRFVDPANGDYRLLPDSPAVLALKDKDGKPAGAFGVGPIEDGAKARPTLSLAFRADTRRGGRFGEYTFFSDPWKPGGGVTTFIRELREEGAVVERIAGAPEAEVEVRAFDPIGAVTKTRVTIGDSAPTETAYSFIQRIKLPDKDAAYRVKLEVQNDRGAWSTPAEAIVRLERTAPKLVGEPKIIANDNGLIVTFRTETPCMASLKYGNTTEYGQTVEPAKLTKRQWDSNDGGDWIETWTIPSNEFALPILKPNVTTGQKLHFKISLRGESGQTWESDDVTAVVKGPTRTLFVSPSGVNSADHGSKESPYKTIQYAADRALPGDRVLLLPGVYTGYTMITHGGVDEKTPLTIEAEQLNTVTLDSAKREPGLIHVENASHVILRGLRIVYFQRTGVSAYRAPFTTVDRCVFWNGPGWVTGNAVFCMHSPNCTIARTLAVGAEGGFLFILSPNATVTNNTCSQGMYAACSFVWSEKGSVMKNNSFPFAGNDILGVMMHSPDDIKRCQIDYNNLGAIVSTYEPNQRIEKENPDLWKQIKAQEFPVTYTAQFRTVSKHVANGYLTLKSWQEATGQDKHSIFADPQYVNPMPPIDHWDWRVKPTSPNLKAGEGGGLIGAFGAAQ